MRAKKTTLFPSFLIWTMAPNLAAAAELPQLDASKFAPQVIWLAISFGILYIVMSKVALPKIGDVLEQRSILIEGNLKRAEELKIEAESARKAYDDSLAAARADAHQRIKNVRDASAAEEQKRFDDLDAKLAEQVKSAEANIAEARANAMGDIRDMASEVVGAAVEKLIGEKADNTAINAAVDAVMKE